MGAAETMEPVRVTTTAPHMAMRVRRLGAILRRCVGVVYLRSSVGAGGTGVRLWRVVGVGGPLCAAK